MLCLWWYNDAGKHNSYQTTLIALLVDVMSQWWPKKPPLFRRIMTFKWLSIYDSTVTNFSVIWQHVTKWDTSASYVAMTPLPTSHNNNPRHKSCIWITVLSRFSHDVIRGILCVLENMKKLPNWIWKTTQGCCSSDLKWGITYNILNKCLLIFKKKFKKMMMMNKYKFHVVI